LNCCPTGFSSVAKALAHTSICRHGCGRQAAPATGTTGWWACEMHVVIVGCRPSERWHVKTGPLIQTVLQDETRTARRRRRPGAGQMWSAARRRLTGSCYWLNDCCLPTDRLTNRRVWPLTFTVTVLRRRSRRRQRFLARQHDVPTWIPTNRKWKWYKTTALVSDHTASYGSYRYRNRVFAMQCRWLTTSNYKLRTHGRGRRTIEKQILSYIQFNFRPFIWQYPVRCVRESKFEWFLNFVCIWSIIRRMLSLACTIPGESKTPE